MPNQVIPVTLLDADGNGYVASGLQGPTGPRGPAGPTGPAGAAGPSGNPSQIPSTGREGDLWTSNGDWTAEWNTATNVDTVSFFGNLVNDFMCLPNDGVLCNEFVVQVNATLNKNGGKPEWTWVDAVPAGLIPSHLCPGAKLFDIKRSMVLTQYGALFKTRMGTDGKIQVYMVGESISYWTDLNTIPIAFTYPRRIR